MSEPLRHPEHAPVGRAEADAHPATEARRVAAQVYDDVEDRSMGTAHQLGLLPGYRLVVHAPQGSASAVEGDVALRDLDLQPMRRELVAAEGPREVAALVLDRLELDQVGAGELALAEDQERTSTSGMATKNLPPHSRTPAICSMISRSRFQGKMKR